MDSNTLPKVLIVEDDDMYNRLYVFKLLNKAQLLIARTVEKAEELFRDNPDIALVIMDACVPGDEPNTYGLTSTIRESFTGPMIAASGSEYYRKQLVAYGCNYSANKHQAGRVALEILSEQHKCET